MKTFKTIELPHLRYKVHFMDISKLVLQGGEKLGGGYTAESGDMECTIFLDDIANTVKRIENMPIIAHEIMHAIQIICEKYHMRVETEQEHTAYIFHYIMEQLISKNK